MTSTSSDQDKRLPSPWADFRYFLFLMWRHLGLPEPTRIQYDIAEWFQYCTIGGGHKRSGIVAFRGVGKSWLRTAGTLWLGGQNPDWKFFLPSASGGKACEFTRFTRMVLDSWDLVKHLRPRPLSGQRDQITGFDFGPAKPAQAPSVFSSGITGQLTGSRANFIFPDDVEIPNNSATDIMRESLFARWSEFDSILSPGGVIHFQGTPQTEESIYMKLIKDMGYQVRFWPSEVPNAAELGCYFGNLAPIINARVLQGDYGAATDPQRFNSEELNLKKASAGLSHYRLHFMLDTSLSDKERYPLRTSDLIVMPLGHVNKSGQFLAPDGVTWGTGPDYRIKELHNLGFSGDHFNRPSRTESSSSACPLKMWIDPAGMGGDEVAYVIMGALNGYLYVPAFGGLKGGYGEENLEFLADLAFKFKTCEILVEDNMGDGMFRALLLPHILKRFQAHVEGYKVNIQKEVRIISALEPVLNSHRLVIDYDAVSEDIRKAKEETGDGLQNSLFYQMTHVTKQRKALKRDDRLDVLAAAVKHWVDFIQIDNKKALEAKEQRELDLEIEKWFDGATPIAPNGMPVHVHQKDSVSGYCDYNDPFKRRIA